MPVLLAEHIRKAAHDRHRCQLCGERIERGVAYLDQRCADDGTAWTFRCHTTCNARYWRAYRDSGFVADDEMLEWSEVLEYEKGLT